MFTSQIPLSTCGHVTFIQFSVNLRPSIFGRRSNQGVNKILLKIALQQVGWLTQKSRLKDVAVRHIHESNCDEGRLTISVFVFIHADDTLTVQQIPQDIVLLISQHVVGLLLSNTQWCLTLYVGQLRKRGVGQPFGMSQYLIW